ncbi:hypothetical protein CYMTET_4286 [Cymbomonas tetramitiformis]|uniref:CCHC-type domain-containing protein n=1 Tax=Cymbomonas tetramitiformis TaxID=36881 RepID=A0AAE0LKJ0_9CHLO|nr:hypothetical protein CYMTET_4286 [Cymbomonas tetramitiformis]
MTTVDSSDGFTTPVPAGIDTRRALPFSDGPEAPIPPTPVKARPLAGDDTGGAAVLREFIEECKTILREPGHRTGIIQQVRDQCRPTHIKASEWVFDIDKIKGQVPREEALDRFTRAVKTQLTDYNLQFAAVFHPTDLTARVLPEASRILFRILTALVRGSCLRLIEESAAVSEEDGRRAWLVICRAVARRRRPPGIEPDNVWGVGFALDLLTLRMCPTYYKDLLQEWSSKTAEGREKRALGIQQYTLAVKAFHQQRTEEAKLLKEKKKKDGVSALAASLLSGESPSAALMARAGIPQARIVGGRRRDEPRHPPQPRDAQPQTSGQGAHRSGGNRGAAPRARQGRGGKNRQQNMKGHRKGSHPSPHAPPPRAPRPQQLAPGGSPTALRVTRDAQGRHTVQCWDCGGPHFRRDCPGGVQSAHMAGFHPEGTPIADILAELDEAFLDPEEEVYESCLYTYSLELGEAPLGLPAAQAAAVVPHSAVDSEEPWTESEWAIWDSCDRSEEQYYDAVNRFNSYQDSDDGDCPDGEDTPAQLHIAVHQPPDTAMSLQHFSVEPQQPAVPAADVQITATNTEFPGAVQLVSTAPLSRPRGPGGPGRRPYGAGHFLYMRLLCIIAFSGTADAVQSGGASDAVLEMHPRALALWHAVTWGLAISACLPAVGARTPVRTWRRLVNRQSPAGRSRPPTTRPPEGEPRAFRHSSPAWAAILVICGLALCTSALLFGVLSGSAAVSQSVSQLTPPAWGSVGRSAGQLFSADGLATGDTGLCLVSGYAVGTYASVELGVLSGQLGGIVCDSGATCVMCGDLSACTDVDYSQYAKWAFLKGSPAALAKIGEHNFDISLFGDDLPPGVGNNQTCPVRYSLSDSCWGHLWAGAYIYGNPPFDRLTCERMLKKANRDFATDPEHTVFLFLIPQSHLSTFRQHLIHWEVLHVYPAGTEGIFSYRREHTYAGRPLQSAGSEGGGDRVFIAGTPFPVAIIYRDRYTSMKFFTPERWCHTAYAHAHGLRLAQLMDLGVEIARPGTTVTREQLLVHRTCAEACAVCARMRAVQPSPKHPPADRYKAQKPGSMWAADATDPITPIG